MIRVSAFAQCDVADLYRILQLRSSVFAVEQQAIYNDLDGRDLDATLLWFEEQGAVLSCMRVLGGPYVLSRIVTRPEARGRGLASMLIDHALGLVPPGEPVSLNAQARLEAWYARWGFQRCGSDVWEDGIRHVPMIRTGA